MNAPTFWRSTGKAPESYLELLRSLYASFSGSLPNLSWTISDFDEFLTNEHLISTYDYCGSLIYESPSNLTYFAGAQAILPGTDDFTV